MIGLLLVDKRQLWMNIVDIITARNSLWVVGGDFNSVRYEDERRNSNFNAAAAREFNFNAGWASAEYRVLPKGRPDHCPVNLKTFSGNFGPKPFRFFNSWLQRDDFEGVVLKANNEFRGHGSPDVVLLQKLKWFRKYITEWKEIIKQKDLEEELILNNEVEDLDIIREQRDLNEEEEWVWEESRRRIREIEEFKYKDLQQKSRCKWATDGDDNTRYFHGLINKRKASNSIPGLMVNGNWETKASKIKKRSFSIFQEEVRCGNES
ncbi:uncharacterized protein LOC110932600 [Helianthus annuus]|uniref:uncharacterized protein LOC110932600 n=1 Tax=Helianthus annuus TaxID=4232 RepID=UPI000B901B42|nr:uncharacterized protein LOC110932600 [Helianthus annuus]